MADARSRRALLSVRRTHLHVARSCLHRHAHFPVAVGAIARLLLPGGRRRVAAPPARAPVRTTAAPTSAGCAALDVACRARARLRRRAGRRGSTRQREHADALAVDADFEILRLHVDRHLLVQVARQLDADRCTARPSGTCSGSTRRRACRTAARAGAVLRADRRRRESSRLWETAARCRPPCG